MKKLLFLTILFLLTFSLSATDRPIKVFLKVTSPVNVQVLLNNKPLMQIDCLTGDNSTYRLVETNLDAPLDFKGKSFSFHKKVSDFYFAKTDKKHISQTISIKINIGSNNQADLVLSESQLSSAYGDEKDIPKLIALLNDHSSENAESKRLYAAKALGHTWKGIQAGLKV